MIERKSYHDAIADPGSLADRRAQLEHEQQQRMEERQQQIALQSSPLSSAQDRIRLWEKLHALALPRSPTHKLLRIIAAADRSPSRAGAGNSATSGCARSPLGPVTRHD